MHVKNKGQVFTWDVIIATTLFLIVLWVFMSLWTDTLHDISSSEAEYDIEWLSTSVSEQLVRNPGVPHNWTRNPELSNIKVIGLADTETVMGSPTTLDRVLDPDKLMYFINATENNYLAIRNKLFGSGKYEFYAEIYCLDEYSLDCFQGLDVETLLNGINITCGNDVVFHIQDDSIWADSSLSGSWHTDENTGNAVQDSSGIGNDGTLYGVLKTTFAVTESPDSYLYEELTSFSDYTIQEGDYLEYYVYWTLPGDRIALDYTLNNGQRLYENNVIVDQNNLLADPRTDLTEHALNQWYRRSIGLDHHKGKTIERFDIACENDETGTRTAYFDNIVIINNGAVKKIIYRSGDLAHKTRLQSSATLSSLAEYASPTAWVEGRYGNAVKLDGINDVVRIPDSERLRMNANQTISLWIKPDSDVSDWARLFGKGDSTNRNYGIWRQNDGDILFQIYGSPAYCSFWNNAGPGSDANIAAGSGWHHIAATYNGTTGRLYIDGSQVYTGQCTTTPRTSDDPATIGYAGYHTYFNGSIDDVKIWDRPLSADEIAQEYDHDRKLCIIGRNQSLSNISYVFYDDKTVTFNTAGDESLPLDEDNLKNPTAKIIVVIYRLSENYGESTATPTSTSTTIFTTTSTTTTTTITTTTAPESLLSCSIRTGTGCLSSEECIFKMSDASNAHAAICAGSAYDYYVCCGLLGYTFSVNVQDGGTCSWGDFVVSLSAVENAHVQQPSYGSYPNDICMSASGKPSGIICEYLSTCTAPYTCLASMSAADNAHVGDCDAHPIKICCK